ncbi:hypothetical protein [Brucella pseudogrignonensis]|uniref:Uncharacterized protein n=1 Tax=Brucella pseudogrignonensis TaxID=419475 RepID=A0A256GDK4_9HYPH|nr:hypothetical protein [Brucella pseudogrignonensis]NKX16143.1 hypothetical protein [Brucella pseudogrignonensis]OYR25212.1 hypothetical protein CEV34_2769 [Brucella pseudogrignonensis]
MSTTQKSRTRHQQGRVSGVLLSGVCVVFSPSGTDFYAVPEGIDGPTFCRNMVDRYAHPHTAERPTPKSARFNFSRFVMTLHAAVTALFRRKVILK